MGSWISNISIRKNGNISMDDVAGYLSQMASERQYEPAASEEEADGAFAIITDENAQWFTICSDLISLEDPELFPEIATPMSSKPGCGQICGQKIASQNREAILLV